MALAYIGSSITSLGFGAEIADRFGKGGEETDRQRMLRYSILATTEYRAPQDWFLKWGGSWARVFTIAPSTISDQQQPLQRHCRALARRGYAAAMSLIFETIRTEGLAEISYLVGDDDEGTAAVFDPRADVDVYLELARSKNVAITHIFERISTPIWAVAAA